MWVRVGCKMGGDGEGREGGGPNMRAHAPPRPCMRACIYQRRLIEFYRVD